MLIQITNQHHYNNPKLTDDQLKLIAQVWFAGVEENASKYVKFLQNRWAFNWDKEKDNVVEDAVTLSDYRSEVSGSAYTLLKMMGAKDIFEPKLGLLAALHETEVGHLQREYVKEYSAMFVVTGAHPTFFLRPGENTFWFGTKDDMLAKFEEDHLNEVDPRDDEAIDYLLYNYSFCEDSFKVRPGVWLAVFTRNFNEDGWPKTRLLKATYSIADGCWSYQELNNVFGYSLDSLPAGSLIN